MPGAMAFIIAGNRCRTGLSNAGSNSFDVTDANVSVEALDAGAFSGVQHLYINIAWRFPSFDK
ncbi:MAG: hypothetical protein U5L96_21150 [Owenweeksia sp.]|nr:hypothetical protein [Owenweeksia sp.]